jgi:hypothetical protein
VRAFDGEGRGTYTNVIAGLNLEIESVWLAPLVAIGDPVRAYVFLAYGLENHSESHPPRAQRMKSPLELTRSYQSAACPV